MFQCFRCIRNKELLKYIDFDFFYIGAFERALISAEVWQFTHAPQQQEQRRSVTSSPLKRNKETLRNFER